MPVGLARKWKSDTFDDVPEGECITSGAYELLSTGKLPASSHDHPSQRRKGSDSEVTTTPFPQRVAAWLNYNRGCSWDAVARRQCSAQMPL